MRLAFRDYRPSDRAHLCQCLNSLGDTTVPLDPWHRITRTPDHGRRLASFALGQVRANHGFVLIAEVDGEPAGAAIAWTHIPSGPGRTWQLPTKIGWVWGLAVLPAMRGRGVGTRLLRECERRFRADGCDQLRLGTFAHNRQALRLYAREGYEARDVGLGKPLGPPKHRWPASGRPSRRKRPR